MHSEASRAERQQRWNPLLHPQHAKVLRLAERREAELEDAVRADREIPDGPLGPIEFETRTFRAFRRQRARQKAAASRRLGAELGELRAWGGRVYGTVAAPAAEEHAALRSAKFWEGRASGQEKRFDNVRACGHRVMRVTSKVCGYELAELPARCGVVRICKACAVHRANKRRRAVARGREDLILDSRRNGQGYRGRAGGRFTEKMFTLTIPHFGYSKIEPGSKLAACCDDYGIRTSIAARVQGLRLAAPIFLAKCKRYFGNQMKRTPRALGADPNDRKAVRFYRLLEWTLGSDGNGHPHFHIYAWTPYLPFPLLREWWAECLRSVGVPVDWRITDAGERVSNVNADVRMLATVGAAELAELIKGGGKAIKLQTLEGLPRQGGLEGVLRYADSTIADTFSDLVETGNVCAQRDLYCALEGVRLAQGSRGFLEVRIRPSCPCCGIAELGDGRSVWEVGFSDPCGARYYAEEQGPP